jgi:uncharacterized membrane protein required for colicin V production
MFIIVDAVLLAVVAICAIVGWKKGFVDRVLTFFSGIIAFFAAYFITPLIAPTVNEKLFYNVLADKTREAISGMAEGVGKAELFGSGDKNAAFREFIAKFGADYDGIKQTFSQKAEEAGEGLVNGITEKIVNPVSYAVSYALCFIVIFILALIIVWIVKKALDLTAKLPVLKTANSALGLVFGILTGVLIVWVLSAAVKLCLPYLHIMQPEIFPEDLFEKSIVLKLTYYLNALRGMIDFDKIKQLLGR